MILNNGCKKERTITLNYNDVMKLLGILDDAGETAKELEALERFQMNTAAAEVTKKCRAESEKFLNELQNCWYERR